MKKKNLTLMLLLVLFFGITSQLSAQTHLAIDLPAGETIASYSLVQKVPMLNKEKMENLLAGIEFPGYIQLGYYSWKQISKNKSSKAEYFSVKLTQDYDVPYCNDDSIVTASVLDVDPFNEVDTFLLRYTINGIAQLDSIFSVDSLHRGDIVRVFAWDETGAILLAEDSIMGIQDASVPVLERYSLKKGEKEKGYHSNSLACDSTGTDKWFMRGEVNGVLIEYPFTSASLLYGTIEEEGGTHLQTKRMPSGENALTPTIYGCPQQPHVFFVESEPMPTCTHLQLVDGTYCDGLNAKIETVLSDTTKIDSISINDYTVIKDVNNDSIHYYTYASENTMIFKVYSKQCIFTESVDLDRKAENILDVIETQNPIHKDFADGWAKVFSDYPIVTFAHNGDTSQVLETIPPEEVFETKFHELSYGTTVLSIQDKYGCWTSVEVEFDEPYGDYVEYSTDGVSPDGDNMNDVLICYVPNKSIVDMKIYRHEDKVHVYSGNTTIWDATDFDGNIVEDGKYILVLVVELPPRILSDGTTHSEVIRRKKIIKKS